jgi:hypothetical protein
MPRAVWLMVFASAAHSQMIGVLEDVPGTYAGEGHSFHVRAVFFRDGNHEWRAFPSNCDDVDCLKTITWQYPSEVTWTILYQNRSLGTVTANTPRDFGLYSHIGLQDIASQGSVPHVGERSVKYAGYLTEAVYRPLIAVTDPNDWKPSNQGRRLSALRRQELRLVGSGAIGTLFAIDRDNQGGYELFHGNFAKPVVFSYPYH